MVYTQFSEEAFTGYPESIRNRIENNSQAINSEGSQYPNKFDTFINKENASLGGFTVSETHLLSQLNGSTLYLDHRPTVDATGGIATITISDGGIINTAQTDIFAGTIQFSTVPSASPFTVSYTAYPDKVQDSHINSLQNVIMALQSVVGIKTPAEGFGTGLISLPLLVNVDPSTSAELSNLQLIIPNMVIPGHLNGHFYLGTTDIPGAPGYGTSGYIVYIGQTGNMSRNDVHISADTFRLSTNSTTQNGGRYSFGTSTGDTIGISGKVVIASRTIIGLPGGATNVIETGVPPALQTAYDNAALVVHGPIWFGTGMTGNGSITFSNTTGEAVDVQGALIATTLTVNNLATFNGPSIVNGIFNILAPGYLSTNNDITLNNKADGSPAKIDGLDPSYVKAIAECLPNRGQIVQSIRNDISIQNKSPYISGAKQHPLYGYYMYPIIGGWTYTGVVAFNNAKVNTDKNIILLGASITGVGNNSTTNSTNLGNGTLPYGHYATGLFNPGDTFVEFKSVSASDAFSYPIYYHQPFVNAGTLTGVNIYVAADDLALQSNIAGLQYRLYQPGNVPYDHLTGSFGNPNSPLAIFGGNEGGAPGDYPNSVVGLITNQGWAGGNIVQNNNPQLKRTTPGLGLTVGIIDALQKSIGYSASVPPTVITTGVAYIYVAGNEANATVEAGITLKASPTPYGIAGPNITAVNPALVPGKHLPVGEIVATTSNGTSWASKEVTSYRPNGYYDSCWIPLVDYKRTSIPTDIGRCLPFFGSVKGTDFDNANDIYNHQFFIEHNLGPTDMYDLDYHVYVANYGTAQYDTVHGFTGYLAPKFRNSSVGSQNLWTPYSAPYNTSVASHSFAASPLSGTRGFLKEITRDVMLKYIDTRFAQFSVDISDADLQGKSNRWPGYIRVIMKKLN